MQEMRRLISAAVFALCVLTGEARDVVVTTWNMKWFPSGKADLRISQEFESFKIGKAGKMLSDAVSSVGFSEGDGVIIMVEELRDEDVCSNLVARCAIGGLRVAAVSRFRDKAGYPLWQQNAIFTNLKVMESGYVPWQSEPNVDMPRGFTFVVLDVGDGLIACFCIHLKANVNLTGEGIETQKNIYKREYASAQILEKLREMDKRYGDDMKRVVVAGDFNTNDDEDTFVSEATLRSFYGAHFKSCFKGLRKSQRVTHPASGGYPDCTFDYILYRGFGRGLERKIGIGHPISDHNPVSIKLPIKEN